MICLFVDCFGLTGFSFIILLHLAAITATSIDVDDVIVAIAVVRNSCYCFGYDFKLYIYTNLRTCLPLALFCFILRFYATFQSIAISMD